MTTKPAAAMHVRYYAKRDEIIAVATEVLNERGIGGFSLAAVAKRLDMTPASLAYYFRGKDVLAATCVILAAARLMALLDDAEKAPSPEARLTAFVQATFALRRRIHLGQDRALATFNEIRLISSPCRERVIAACRNLFHRIEALFESPELSWIDVNGRAVRARLVLEHLMWAPAWLDDYNEGDYARAAQRLADILIHGVAAHGAPWSPRRDPGLRLVASTPTAITRDDYLLAATELINERGHAGASVDRIAARLNVTKGSFYHHNADKKGLIVACFERSLEIILAAQRDAADIGGDAWHRLSRTCTMLIDGHASGHARLLRTYALGALPAPKRAAMIQRFQACAQRFAAVIGDGIADGSLRAVDPLIAAHVVMATINAAAYSETWGRDARARDILTAYARPALMGLFTRP